MIMWSNVRHQVSASAACITQSLTFASDV